MFTSANHGAEMASDEVLVALINESVNAEHRRRRMAASILVEVLRKGSDLGSCDGVRETIPPDEVAAVADEVKALTTKYRLGGADAPLWQAPPPAKTGSREG